VFLYAGKKDVKSRKGNDARKLHRMKKRDGMVTRRKPKKESKLQENFWDKSNLNHRKKKKFITCLKHLVVCFHKVGYFVSINSHV
jgi:hypothetical protein